MKRDKNKKAHVKSAKKIKEERSRKKSGVFASEKKGSFFRFLGKVMSGFFVIAGFLGFLAKGVQSHYYGTGFSFSNYFYLGLLVFGIFFYFNVRTAEKRMARFRYYKSFMEEKDYIKFSEIEEITGRSLSFLQKDISTMIRKKLFLQAHMNREGTCLFLTKDSFIRYQRGQIILMAQEENVSGDFTYSETKEETRTEEKKEKKAEAETQTETKAEANVDHKENKMRTDFFVQEEYENYLHNIHQKLSLIHHSDVKKAASNICIKGQQILYFKDTIMAKEAAPFLNYFLPITDTIVGTYLELERSGLEDQAVDLKANLNTIEHSFSLFVEKLLEGKSVDVEAEIAAAKTMLTNHLG